MKEDMATFLAAKLFKFFLDVDILIDKAELIFNSEDHIQFISEPISILHAQDDGIIPFELGRRLHEAASKENPKAKFYSFDKNLRLGHDNIYQADSFNDIVKEIVMNVEQSK